MVVRRPFDRPGCISDLLARKHAPPSCMALASDTGLKTFANSRSLPSCVSVSLQGIGIPT